QKRLDEDLGLRARMESLWEAHEAVWEGMGKLDDGSRHPMTEKEAVVRVGGMIRRWQVERARQAAALAGQGGLRISWWRVSAAAVVLLGVGSLAWWGMTPAEPTGLEPPPFET